MSISGERTAKRAARKVRSSDFIRPSLLGRWPMCNPKKHFFLGRGLREGCLVAAEGFVAPLFFAGLAADLALLAGAADVLALNPNAARAWLGRPPPPAPCPRAPRENGSQCAASKAAAKPCPCKMPWATATSRLSRTADKSSPPTICRAGRASCIQQRKAAVRDSVSASCSESLLALFSSLKKRFK